MSKNFALYQAFDCVSDPVKSCVLTWWCYNLSLLFTYCVAWCVLTKPSLKNKLLSMRGFDLMNSNKKKLVSM